MQNGYVRFYTVVALAVTLAVFAMFLTTPKWEESHVHTVRRGTHPLSETETRGTYLHDMKETPECTLTRLGKRWRQIVPNLSLRG